MAVKDVVEQVAKESYELLEGVAKFAGAMKQALADGWQPGQDLPAILSSAMADLVPAMQGADKIGEELKMEAEAFATAVMLGGKKIVKAVAG